MPFVGTIEYTTAFRGVPALPTVNTSNLVIWVDSGNAASYSGAGTKWSNLISAQAATYWMNLSNSPTFSNVTYNGKTNNTLYFNGLNNYSVPNTSLATVANNASWNETREYWVYWNGSPGCLTMESGSTLVDSGWFDAQMSMSNTSLAYSVWQGNVAMTAYIANNVLTSNTWNHLVWQHSKGSNLLMAYVNGVQTYSNASVARTTPTDGAAAFYPTLCAGSATNFGYGSGSYWTGHLGVFRWYTRILSVSEISSNYNAERGRFGR